MKFASVLKNTTRLLASFKLKRDPKLGKLDFGILKVSMMIAALDGEVFATEIETFEKLAKKCRGYSATAAKAAREEALRSAGYLLLKAKTGTAKELLNAFIGEALAAMPAGFLNGSMEDIRRAFVMWTAMGMGDGEFSAVERQAITQLKKSWTDMRTALLTVEQERWCALSPSYRTAYAVNTEPPAVVKLLADDFLSRTEAALAKSDNDAIKNLIRNG